jgi:hypothetical protein
VVDVSSPRAWSAQRASVNRVTWCVRQAAPSCCTNVEGSCTSSLPPIRFLTLSGAPAVACGASREVATVHDCRRVASLTWARDEQLRWYDKRSRPCRACIIGMVRLRRLHALVLTQYAIVGVQARPPRMTSRGKTASLGSRSLESPRAKHAKAFETIYAHSPVAHSPSVQRLRRDANPRTRISSLVRLTHLRVRQERAGTGVGP